MHSKRTTEDPKTRKTSQERLFDGSPSWAISRPLPRPWRPGVGRPSGTGNGGRAELGWCRRGTPSAAPACSKVAPARVFLAQLLEFLPARRLRLGAHLATVPDAPVWVLRVGPPAHHQLTNPQPACGVEVQATIAVSAARLLALDGFLIRVWCWYGHSAGPLIRSANAPGRLHASRGLLFVRRLLDCRH